MVSYLLDQRLLLDKIYCWDFLCLFSSTKQRELPTIPTPIFDQLLVAHFNYFSSLLSKLAGTYLRGYI